MESFFAHTLHDINILKSDFNELVEGNFQKEETDTFDLVPIRLGDGAFKITITHSHTLRQDNNILIDFAIEYTFQIREQPIVANRLVAQHTFFLTLETRTFTRGILGLEGKRKYGRLLPMSNLTPARNKELEKQVGDLVKEFNKSNP